MKENMKRGGKWKKMAKAKTNMFTDAISSMSSIKTISKLSHFQKAYFLHFSMI